MSSLTDLVKSSISDSKELLGKNFLSIFIKYAKVYLFTLVVSILLFLILTISLGIANPGSKTSFGLLMLPILFIVILVSSAMQSVIYNIIDNTYKKKETPILGQIKENSLPVIKYHLIVLPALFILLYPIITYVISSSVIVNSASLPEPNLLVWGISIIIVVILAFFVQFGLYELLLSKKGVIESFKGSFDLVKTNMAKVFVLDILILSISLIIQVVAGLSSLISGIGPIGTGVYLIISFVLSLVSQIVLTSFIYFFYREVGKSTVLVVHG